MRARRWRVTGRFDGTAGATVEVFEIHGELMFSVRPLARRRVFELRLSDVARGVVFDVVRAEVAHAQRATRARNQSKGRDTRS